MKEYKYTYLLYFILMVLNLSCVKTFCTILNVNDLDMAPISSKTTQQLILDELAHILLSLSKTTKEKSQESTEQFAKEIISSLFAIKKHFSKQENTTHNQNKISSDLHTDNEQLNSLIKNLTPDAKEYLINKLKK